MSLEQALNIPGWMAPQELEWLATEAKKHKKILELGSFMGRSTMALAETAGTVTAVDTWKGSPEHEQLLKDRDEEYLFDSFFLNLKKEIKNVKVVPLRMDSASAAISEALKGQKFDMIFIDAAHDYENVKLDIATWLPFLEEGGLFCGHDYYLDGHWPDVRRAVDESLPSARSIPNGTIWFVPTEKETIVPSDGIITIPRTDAKGIALCIVSGRAFTPTEMIPAMMMQSWPTNIRLDIGCVYSKDTDAGRIKGVKDALAKNCKYIWFVDDDTVPPMDAGRQLIYLLEQNGPPNGKVMVSVGIYCTRSVPPEPIVYKGPNEGCDWDWKVGEVFKRWGAGTGCMMINLDVFKDIPEPWFKTTSSAQHSETDDLYFCQKVKEAGYELMVHGGILCHHYDQDRGAVYMLPRQSRPYLERISDPHEPKLAHV